jgi:uncharacterized protein YndB with AHSA1/START domain
MAGRSTQKGRAMSFKFTVSAVIPAKPKAIYDAWLDTKGHTAMTGAPAKASKKAGGKWTAAGDYCWGVNLELVPGKRIVQSWRSTDFKDGDPDSRIAVTLKPVAGGTKVTLLHSSIPDSQKDAGYKEGWFEFYFDPMQPYFAKPGKKAKKKGAAKR